MNIMKRLKFRNLMLIVLVINFVFIDVASSDVGNKKITLQMKKHFLKTFSEGALKTTKALGFSGKKINVFEKKLVLPNGKTIFLPSLENSRIFTSNDKVVIATTSRKIKEPGVSIKIYDLNGVATSERNIEFGSAVTVADSGYTAVTDNYEGYGENIFVYDKNGNDVNAIKPYKSGFEFFALHAMNAYFVAALVPVDKIKEKSKVIIINQADGQILKEITINLHTPQSIQGNTELFMVHDEYVSARDNVFHSNIHLLNISGEVINTISSNAQLYLLSPSTTSIIICDSSSIKAVNYESNAIIWKKEFSEIYTHKIIAKPADIPAGFNLYPLQLLQLSTDYLIAINLGQSSFNPIHAKYKAELILLDKNTGELMTQQYLGGRNMNLKLLTTSDGIDVSSNDGYFSYQIISQQ